MSDRPASTLEGKRLLIFDDGLRSVDGHWYEYDRAVAEANCGAGVRVTLICHRDFKDTAALEAAGVEVLPLVTQSVWGGAASGAGLLGEARHTFGLARANSRILKAHLKGRTYDCVFLPNALLPDVVAWLMTARLRRAHVRRLVLLFRFKLGEAGSVGEPRYARKLAIWGVLLRRMKRSIADGRLVLLTDSERLADEYFAVSGFRPAVAPSPRISPVISKIPRPAGKPFLFATLGAARLNKGIDLFQDAIAQLLNQGRADDMRFLLQWNRDVRSEDGTLYARNPALEASDRIDYLETPMSSEDYDRLFGQIDCMVLPYRRKDYRAQISGVAVEAACAGIPIIYTNDTWLSDFVGTLGAGIGIEDGSVDQLASAIATISRDRDAFEAKAEAQSVAARRANSPEAFQRAIWGLDDPAASIRPAA